MSDLRIDDFPPDLHRQLRMEAAAKSKSLRGVVLDILRGHVKRRQDTEKQMRKQTEEVASG